MCGAHCIVLERVRVAPPRRAQLPQRRGDVADAFVERGQHAGVDAARGVADVAKGLRVVRGDLDLLVDRLPQGVTAVAAVTIGSWTACNVRRVTARGGEMCNCALPATRGGEMCATLGLHAACYAGVT